MFFKNKIEKFSKIGSPKYFYRSAIDNALINNQIMAVELMINFIVLYQNSFTSSFLFKKNFMKILAMGIPVSNLLSANIFRFELKFDEWPQAHSGEEEVRPYNGNLFELR